MLHGIHTVAQLRHVFGEVATVYACQHRASGFQRTDIEATMALQLSLVSGASVHVVQTAEARLPGDTGGYTLFGDTGCLRARDDRCCFIDDEGQEECVSLPAPPLSEFAQELAAFAAWASGAGPGPTTGRSERRSLAIVQAGYESAASGQPIDLLQRFGEL